MHIYIVNGAPGSGKTTFEQYVQDIIKEDVYIMSTVDTIKKAAQVLGWDGIKTPESRKFLSDLKQLWIEWNDGVFKDIKHRLSVIEKHYEVYDISSNRAIVFIDSREPAEIDRLKRELGARTILIERPSGADDARILNSSDRDVNNYTYDIKIINSGNLDYMRQFTEKFIEVENLK